MLMANLPLRSVSEFFHPLPLFEQAAPLGYLFVASTLTSLFPDSGVIALRILSVSTSLLAASLIYASLRRLAATEWTISLALVFTCLTDFAVIYSVEIKQYIFDYAFTTVMLYLSVRLLREHNRKNLAYFVVGGLFSILFSFSAPIIICAFGAGVIAQQWVTISTDPRGRGKLETILALTILAIAFLIYYLGYTRPMTKILFAAYANIYDVKLLTFPPLTLAEFKLWLRFPTFLIQQVELGIKSYLGMEALEAIGIAVVFTIGFATMVSRFILLPVSFVVATVLIYALSLAGLLPIAEQRHFGFMVPITGIILSFGCLRCLRWLSRWATPRQPQRLLSGSYAFVIVIVGALSLIHADRLARQQISPLIDYIISHGDAKTPVWVYYGAQPAMRVLAPKTLVQIGLVSHSSDAQGWIWKVRNYPDYGARASYFEEFRRTVNNLPQLWLIFSHYSLERDGLKRYFEIAQEEIGGCRQVLVEKGAVLWKCN
jgi:hypothetical protein